MANIKEFDTPALSDDAEAGAPEIEVTRAMIEAGAFVLKHASADLGYMED